jgi:hypothetical protein
MKKSKKTLIATILIGTLLTGCGAHKNDAEVDLTEMSATMVYSTVADMLSNPDNYKGKSVRMDGDSNITHDGTHSCIVYDALGCCAEGIEYVLSEEYEDYPADGKHITVVGTFATYTKNKTKYFVLINSQLE